MKKMKKKTFKKLFGTSIGAWLFSVFLMLVSDFPSIIMWLLWGFMVYMYLISLAFIINYIYKIYKDKDNENIIIYYIYSFMHILCLEESKYIGLFILLIGSYIIYFIKNDKVKDLFKGICYTLLLILYKFIISDIKLDDFTVLSMGIYIVYLLLFSKEKVFK